jgi:branched-chain amino acid aminotransferase
MGEHFFIYNNHFYQENTPVLNISNRSLMYGDGLFETIRIHRNRFVNETLHFERFFAGLQLLNFPASERLTKEFFKNKIRELLLKNGIQDYARVRLMAFRKEGNTAYLMEEPYNYIIEAWPMEEAAILNEVGLVIDIFDGVKKSCDPFSNIKSNNYLASVMARLFAKENNLDECLILNSFDRICESAIANVFIIKDQIIYTPSLSEGCVAGIVRRWLIEHLPSGEFQILQKEITQDDVMNADEIFLTNSIKPIRWVRSIHDKYLENKSIRKIANFVYRNMVADFSV